MEILSDKNDRSALRSNIEIKARVGSHQQTRAIAQSLPSREQETEHQVDTYFNARSGRLKLREINDKLAFLIAYERPDQDSPKQSEYYLVPIEDPLSLKEALTSALGILKIVKKRREIFLYENVRIHLDEVQDLGSFLEFEAVLGPKIDAEQGRRQLETLCQTFRISVSDLLTGSYGEM